MSTADHNRVSQAILTDVSDILFSRPREARRHYRLDAKKSLGFDVTQIDPYVDRAAMSARAVISTAAVDRVGDMLLPSGCNLTNYKSNPVVLWGHGIEGLALPIATSNDPSGNLAITVDDDAVTATSYFSQSNLEAAQIFELIDEGIVRATSVRETPMKSRMVMKDGQHVLLVEEWDLEEWSWCSIGVNPEAVAKSIAKNRLAGKPITPSIMKSLQAVAPDKQTVGIGFTELKKMAEDKKPDNDNDGDEGASIETSNKDAGMEQHPYGSQLIQAYHGALSSAVSKAESGMGAMEHPEATPAMRTAIDAVKDVMTGLKGAHSSCYPNCAMKDDDGGGDDSGDDSDSEMKAWLAKGCNQLTLKGASSTLLSLKSARNLTPSQRQVIGEMASGFDRWASQAKSLIAKKVENEKPKPASEWTPEQAAEAEALFAKMNS